MTNKAEAKQRLQFDASSRVIEKLNELAVEHDASSRAEVIRNAVNLYARLTQLIKEDGMHGEFRLVRKDGTIERWRL